MTGRTHDLAGFTLLLGTGLVYPPDQITLATLIVSIFSNQIGALFPDFDQAASSGWEKLPAGHYFGRLLSPLAGGHRHITHSLLGLTLFGYAAYKLLETIQTVLLVNINVVWISFMIGFISHLIMDAFTDVGIPIFWPLRFHFGMPPIQKLRITTDGLAEKLLVFPGLLILNFYLIYHNYDLIVKMFKDNIVR